MPVSFAGLRPARGVDTLARGVGTVAGWSKVLPRTRAPGKRGGDVTSRLEPGSPGFYDSLADEVAALYKRALTDLPPDVRGAVAAAAEREDGAARTRLNIMVKAIGLVVPKGSGSENMSFLAMLNPADGIAGRSTRSASARRGWAGPPPHSRWPSSTPGRISR